MSRGWLMSVDRGSVSWSHQLNSPFFPIFYFVHYVTHFCFDRSAYFSSCRNSKNGQNEGNCGRVDQLWTTSRVALQRSQNQVNSLSIFQKNLIVWSIIFKLRICCLFFLFCFYLDRPKSGSMLLYSRKKVRYRRDGYCWKKRKDGKTTREDHMKLKVQGTEVRHTFPIFLFLLLVFLRQGGTESEKIDRPTFGESLPPPTLENCSLTIITSTKLFCVPRLLFATRRGWAGASRYVSNTLKKLQRGTIKAGFFFFFFFFFLK